jgi:hypothetical protein
MFLRIIISVILRILSLYYNSEISKINNKYWEDFKMMEYNDMMNIMKAVELENYYKQVNDEIEWAMLVNDNFMKTTDAKIDKEQRTRNIDDAKVMRRKCDKLVKLIEKLNDIEADAIKIKDNELMWKCESKKAKMIMQMQLMQDKYDF